MSRDNIIKMAHEYIASADEEQQQWAEYLKEAAERKRLEKAVKEWRDRCIHPSGPHPMHEFCAWRTPKTEGVTK